MKLNTLKSLKKSINSLFSTSNSHAVKYESEQIESKEQKIEETEKSENEKQERSKAEILESEEKYKTIFENVRDCIVVLDAKGIIREVSPNVNQFFGFTQKEVLNKRFTTLDIFLKENTLQMIQLFKEIFITKTAKPLFELKIKNKKGKIISVETSTRLIKNNNKIDRIITTVRNISSRKKTEEELKESEEKYKALYRTSRDAIMMLMPKKGFFSGNPATIEMFECETEDEFSKLTPAELSPQHQPDGQESKKKAQEMMRIAMKNGSHFFEWTHKTKKGKEFDATVLLTRTRIDGEDALQATVRDISERKKTEEKLKNSEKRFREISDLLPEIIFEIDLNGKLTFVNQKTYDSTIYTKEDMKNGLYAQQLLIPEDRLRALNDIKNILAGKPIGIREYTAKRKNGSTFPILVHSTPIIRNKQAIGLRGLIIDISERKKTEKEKQKLQKKLKEYAQKLEIKVNKLEKNKIGLTEKEKLVLYGLCQYPQDNDRELSEKLKLNRSTITAIKNRLLEKNYYQQAYIPNDKQLINCNLLVFIYGTITENQERNTIRELFSNINFFNLQVTENEFIGILPAENLTNAHQQINKLLEKEVELQILNEEPTISYLPCAEKNIYAFLDYSKILKKIFEIKHEEQTIKQIPFTQKKIKYKFKRNNLRTKQISTCK